MTDQSNRFNRSLTAAQSLGTLRQQPSDFLSFLYPSKTLLIVLASGHLLARLIVLMFVRAANSNATKRSNRFGWLHQPYRQIKNQLSNLAVLFVFLGVFDFINLTLWINSIKTNKLIIDTSHLLDSTAKIESTKARPVFYQGESDYKLISEAPKNSQLYHLFHSKFERKNGFYLLRIESIDEDLFKLLLESYQSTFYFFMDRTALVFTIFKGSSLFKNIFFKPVNYYETLSVTYLRKNLEKSRKSNLIKM